MVEALPEGQVRSPHPAPSSIHPQWHSRRPETDPQRARTHGTVPGPVESLALPPAGMQKTELGMRGQNRLWALTRELWEQPGGHGNFSETGLPALCLMPGQT